MVCDAVLENHTISAATTLITILPAAIDDGIWMVAASMIVVLAGLYLFLQTISSLTNIVTSLIILGELILYVTELLRAIVPAD
jgi:hypothetical protein